MSPRVSCAREGGDPVGDQLLSVRDLKVWFPVRLGLAGALRGQAQKHVKAVDGIDFEVEKGQVYCLVGESGCGKTTTGKAILRLNETTSGNLLYQVPPEEMERLDRIEARLGELMQTLQGHEGNGRVAQEFADLQRLKGQAIDALYPWKGVNLQLRREKLERTVAFLEDRIAGLRGGTDPTVTRMLSHEQEELKVMETMGARFTSKKMRKLTRLRREAKDARYLVRRAEATKTGLRKANRKLRTAERRLKALEDEARQSVRVSPDSLEVRRRALADRQKLITDAELSTVLGDLRKAKDELATLVRAQEAAIATSGRTLWTIETGIQTLRDRGGPELEALELQALRDEILRRHDLTQWSREETAELRKHMQIIYQDPYESLNPKMSIFDIVAEPLLANKIVDTPAQAEVLVRKALEDVGLEPADEYMFRYPHELSGGQRQRVGIATALVVGPDFIMADEPVSMLDASVRTEILALLLDLKKQKNLTYLFITHDLGLAWIIADKIAVMYLGKIVEQGDGPTVIKEPQHPYTKSLISVVPSPNPEIHREKIILKGERPNPVDIPLGCRFHPRCPNAVGICGWDSHEVREELERLFKEDKVEAKVSTVDPLNLRVATGGAKDLAGYLHKRIQEVALGRPALGAIRDMRPEGTDLVLVLHEPKEPELHPTPNGASVACLVNGSVAA